MIVTKPILTSTRKTYLISVGFLLLLSILGIFGEKGDFSESNGHLDHLTSNNSRILLRPQTDYVVSSIEIDDMATGLNAHNWSWAVAQPWCSGSGTRIDPYIIHSVGIDAAGKGFGISISNSVQHVILQYCEISNGGLYDEAVLLHNVSNCKMQHNLFSENVRAIIASSYCDNNTIYNNTLFGITTSTNDWAIYFNSYCENNSMYKNDIQDMHYGIRLNSYCSGNFIENNTISSISGDGIYVSGSSQNTIISGNTLHNGDNAGIYIQSSLFTTIFNNTISSMDTNAIFIYNMANHANISENTLSDNLFFGIRLDSCQNATLRANIMSDSGLGLYANSPTLAYYTHDVDPSNLVDGKYIYMYNSVSDLTNANFTNAGQIYLVECNNSELSGFTLNENDYGMFLAGCRNISIHDNTFLNHYYDGIYCFNTIDSNFTKNNCSLNLRIGIYLDQHCDFNDLVENEIRDNGDTYGADYGIYIYSFSDHNQVINNTVIGSADHGIGIYSSSTNNTIQHNQIHLNQQYGVYIGSHCDLTNVIENNITSGTYGLYITHYCDKTRIIGNNVSFTNNYGLYITYYNYDINISSNIIRNCGQSGEYAGIYVSSNSDRMLITHNQFIANTRYGLFFTSVREAIVQDNIFIGTGFGISGSDDTHFNHYFNGNNTLNGKIIYYYLNENSLEISNFTNAAEIYMINCVGGEIESPSIIDTQYGLFLYNTSHIVVNNGNFSYNEKYAIYLYKTTSCNITETYCSYSEDNSLVYLSTSSSYNNISRNTLIYPQSTYQESIHLTTNCIENIFDHNEIIDAGDYGIYLSTGCSRNTFTHNIINKTRRYEGIYLTNDCDENYFKSNTIISTNRYAIYLYSGCDNNSFVENTIRESSGAYTIYVYYYSESNRFIGNHISENNGHGFYIRYYSHYTQIIANNISNNGQSVSYGYGIYVYSLCDYVNITGNLITYNRFAGIFIEDECDDGIISGNDISHNLQHGIYAVDQCKTIRIERNNLTANGQHGLYVFMNCDDFFIQYNQISNNTDHGVYFDDRCDANLVYNNTLKFNVFRGIGLYATCSDNDLFRNVFLNNTQHAYDDNALSTWHNGSLGNYWDNYTGRDLDDDGIGDDPWLIPGAGMNYDDYPIWEDGKDLDPQPDISSPDDVFYYYGAEGATLSWIGNATSPDYFTITRNGTLIFEGVWFNFEPITINVDSLNIGQYVYNCTINSTYHFNNENSDITVVNVLRTAPVITSPLDFEYAIGESSKNITWFGDAPFPHQCIIFLDGSLQVQMGWNDRVPIVFEIPVLQPGTYSLECFLNVTSGEMISDSVLVTITEPPLFISQPPDISYVVTDTGIQLEWYANSPIPDQVVVYRDSEKIFQDAWISGTNVSIPCEGLEPGTYTYLCVFNSTTGNFISDVVSLRVIEPLLEISHPPDVTYYYGELASITIQWNGTSLIPDTALIYHDSIVVNSSNWDSSVAIQYRADNLALGAHVFECCLNSTSGLEIRDTVLISVLEPLPVIVRMQDLEINGSTENESLSWIGYSEFADNVTVYRNGELIYEGPWESGVTLEIPLGNLSAGTYVYECVMITNTGEQITDSVLVYVSKGSGSISSQLEQELQEQQEKADRRRRIFWTIIIILGILLGGAIGVISYYVRKQKDYMTQMDLLRRIDDERYELAKQQKYKTLADEILKGNDYMTEADKVGVIISPVAAALQKVKAFFRPKTRSQKKLVVMESPIESEDLETKTRFTRRKSTKYIAANLDDPTHNLEDTETTVIISAPSSKIPESGEKSKIDKEDIGDDSQMEVDDEETTKEIHGEISKGEDGENNPDVDENTLE